MKKFPSVQFSVCRVAFAAFLALWSFGAFAGVLTGPTASNLNYVTNYDGTVSNSFLVTSTNPLVVISNSVSGHFYRVGIDPNDFNSFSVDNGSSVFFDCTASTFNVNVTQFHTVGNATVDGSIHTDAGQIYSDGSGNLNINGNLTVGSTILNLDGDVVSAHGLIGQYLALQFNNVVGYDFGVADVPDVGVVFVDCSTNSIMGQLPTTSQLSGGASELIMIKRIDYSTNSLTMWVNSGTVEGQTNYMLGPGAAVWFMSNSTNQDWAVSDAFGLGKSNQLFGVSTDGTRRFKDIATTLGATVTQTDTNITFGAPLLYTGKTNIGSAATSLTIALGHTMPSTNYFPAVHVLGAALSGISATYSSITTTNFAVNFSAALGAANTNLAWMVSYNP